MGAGVSSSRRPPVVAVHPATSNQVTSPNPPSLPFKKAKHPRPRQVSFPRIHQNTSRRGRYMRLAVRFDPGGKDARRAFKSAKKWRAAWVEFVTLLEAGARGVCGLERGTYETLNRPIGFSGPFTHTSHLIAQLPALSHTFLTQLDAHITLLALMSHQPTHAREAIKREEGVMMLRNMMATLGEMWGAVGKICGEMEGAFGGSDKEGGKDGGREDDWGRDGCVEAKMKILKRVGRVFGKAARRWECVCVEEVKAVGSLREWWRKDWMARMKNSTTDTTPTYLTLLDTWHTLLTSPAALPSRTGVTRATAILSSALTQQHDSERATSQNIALVRKLSRNATAASKKLSRGRVAPADAAVEYSVKGVKERRKLSQDLHALDVAKERLEEGVRRNKELAEGVVCRAVGGLWGSLGRYGVVLEGLYVGVLRERESAAFLDGDKLMQVSSADSAPVQRPSREEVLNPAVAHPPPSELAHSQAIARPRRASRVKIPLYEYTLDHSPTSIPAFPPVVPPKRDQKRPSSATYPIPLPALPDPNPNPPAIPPKKPKSSPNTLTSRPHSARASYPVIKSLYPSLDAPSLTDQAHPDLHLHPHPPTAPPLHHFPRSHSSISSNSQDPDNTAFPTTLLPSSSHSSTNTLATTTTTPPKTKTSKKVNAPPPPPFAPGYDPTLREPSRIPTTTTLEPLPQPSSQIRKPAPPPIPARPAHIRKRLYKPAGEKGSERVAAPAVPERRKRPRSGGKREGVAC